MKDLKKYKLDVEALKDVSGGAGEDWSEIARRMMEYSNEQLDDSTRNDITKVPDLDNPHSKKAKGKLYR